MADGFLNFAGDDVMQFMTTTFNESGIAIGYNCTLCGKSMTKKYNMKQHMILVHTTPTREVCKYCKRVFSRKLYLNRHIQNRECLRNVMFDSPE